MTAPLIVLDDVAKRYPNGTLALDGASFSVEQGEFVSLLGPSGCGKSTALRLIAGLLKADRGTVNVAGQGADIGFVFQEPTLMPWARVFDNVWLPLRLAGQSREQSRERVEAALALVGLTEFAQAFPRELSGGMKMRVSIARALVTRPRVLLMDEPFAALDEMTRGRLNDDLLALWREHGLTVVFVTHSVYESVYLSERVLVMAARPGRIGAEEEIAAPAQRDAEFRLSPAYAEACRRVSAALQRAGEKGGGYNANQ